jgi:hypothetical protein
MCNIGHMTDAPDMEIVPKREPIPEPVRHPDWQPEPIPETPDPTTVPVERR